MDSIEEKTLNLSTLVARRDAKRRQVEALGEEMQAIQRQMDGIHKELTSLNGEIQAAELDIQQSNASDDNNNNAVVDINVTNEQDSCDTTSNRLAMTHADEFLTDPMTQGPNDEHFQPNHHDDVEARDIESFYDEDVVVPRQEQLYDEDVVPSPSPPRRSSSSGSNGSLMGQLQITRGNSLTGGKRKRNSSISGNGGNNNSRAPATLDQYFVRSDVTPSTGDSSVAARGSGGGRPRRDSLQSLPPPRQLHAATNNNNNAYSVASIPQDRTPYTDQLKSDSFPWSQQMYSVLRNVFRIESFRGQQKEIINCTMNGDDAFVIMRTGGGKSLAYQLPALLEGCGPDKKITLVISPLLSLITDQVDQMNGFSPGSAVSFTSKMPGGVSEHTRRWNTVRDRMSGVCLIFVTPEKVYKSNKLKSELQKLHAQNRLGRFVVDEAHCACQWGHDFRPDYTKLGVLKTMFPTVPLIAVTATASDRVRQDVCNILRLGRNYQLFRSTANRPNLAYSVIPKVDGKDKVVDEMAAFIKEKHPRNAGIIYAFSRKEADDVADKLCDRGIVARSYHSSVNDSAKDMIHRSWMRNETQVVVATIAFGLGINKPDVRFVLHHSLSKSLEAYYQESGRAGRDGNPADCILYYSTKDVSRTLEMIHGDNGGPAFWTMVRYSQAMGNDAICRNLILSALCEPGSADPQSILDQYDGITTENRNVGAHAKTVTELLQVHSHGGKLTIPQLVKEWRTKPENAVDCVQRNPPGKDITSDECSRIIVELLVAEILQPDVVYNNKGFSSMYLKLGPNAYRLLSSPDPDFFVRFPLRKKKASTETAASAKKSRAVVPDTDGWISAKKKKPTTRKKPYAKRKRAASKKKRKTRTFQKKASRKRAPPTSQKKPVAEVIELDMSSSSDDDSIDDVPPARVPERRSTSVAAETHIPWEDQSDDELPARVPARLNTSVAAKKQDLWDAQSDSEYEFD